ncbi:MAG: hypothetical protein ABIH23_04440, partial [bacterium]
QVTGELYPPEVFPPASALLDRAEALAQSDTNPEFAARVAFHREGLRHAILCSETAHTMNRPEASPSERAAALKRLGEYRRSVEHIGIANLDRAATIEVDSWKDVGGLMAPSDRK